MNDRPPDDNLEARLKRDYAEPAPRPEFARDLEARLADRLRRAAPGPQTSPPLRAPRRRPWRRAALFAAAAALVLAAVGLLIRNDLERRAAQGRRIARLQADVAGCESEIRLRSAAIRRILARERRAAVDARLADLAARPDPLIQVAAERERAAATMLATADRMYRRLKLRESAVETYQRAVVLFPGTQGASLARQRLSEIQSL